MKISPWVTFIFRTYVRMSPIFFMKHLQLRFCFSLAPSIKLMTHLESRHTNYSLLKKKRCGEVNRHRNTNNILLPLLFNIKSCLSISLKRSVLIRHTVGTTSGPKRYYEMLRGTSHITTRTTRYYETVRVTTSCTTWYYQVLRVTMRYYKWYEEVLRGNTSCTANHYLILRDV